MIVKMFQYLYQFSDYHKESLVEESIEEILKVSAKIETTFEREKRNRRREN